MKPPGKNGGRPSTRWMDAVDSDMKLVGLERKMADVRRWWRRTIDDDHFGDPRWRYKPNEKKYSTLELAPCVSMKTYQRAFLMVWCDMSLGTDVRPDRAAFLGSLRRRCLCTDRMPIVDLANIQPLDNQYFLGHHCGRFRRFLQVLANSGPLRQNWFRDPTLRADARHQAITGVVVEVNEKFSVRWHLFDDLKERLAADLRRHDVDVIDVGGGAHEADPVTMAHVLVFDLHDLVNASKTISHLKHDDVMEWNVALHYNIWYCAFKRAAKL